VAKISKVVLEKSEQVRIELVGQVVVAGVDVSVDLEKDKTFPCSSEKNRCFFMG